jgi:hypothetical protein
VNLEKYLNIFQGLEEYVEILILRVFKDKQIMKCALSESDKILINFDK